jgi:hypothetical protein
MTSSHAPSKFLLIADPRANPAGQAPVAIRRYRLARLRLDAPSVAGGARFEPLKPVFD